MKCGPNIVDFLLKFSLILFSPFPYMCLLDIFEVNKDEEKEVKVL